MAVAYISDADNAASGAATSIVFAGFAVSGTNPVILLVMALNGTIANETVTSVVCSAGLTSGTPVEIIRVQTGGAVILSIWAIPAPVGTGTITANLSASMNFDANAILMQGADQTTPCLTGAGNAESAAGASPNPLTLTLANIGATDGAVGIGANANAGDAPRVTTGTETFFDNADAVNAASGYRLGAGAFAVTWGVADAVDTLAVVRVIAASGVEKRWIFGPH